jgi:hypothetical protein
MNCEPGEEAARPSRRQSHLLAPDLDFQRSEQADQHRYNTVKSVTGLAPDVRIFDGD